jgi:hypothetical protein
MKVNRSFKIWKIIGLNPPKITNVRKIQYNLLKILGFLIQSFQLGRILFIIISVT